MAIFNSRLRDSATALQLQATRVPDLMKQIAVSLLSVLTIAGCSASVSAPKAVKKPQFEPPPPVERELAGGQSHDYEVKLQADHGSYLVA